MKKKLIIVIVTVIVIAAGYVGFIKYKQHNFVESITPHVKDASLRLANVVRFDTEETKITYRELFEKLESDIAEIDKRILDVQTIATPSNKGITDPVLAYLKGSQELLRSLLLKYRKQLTLSSAIDLADRSIDDMRNVGLSGLEYATTVSGRAYIDLGEVEKEYSEAISDVLNATNNMKKAHANLASSIPSDALADPTIFEAIAKKNETEKSGFSSNEKEP